MECKRQSTVCIRERNMHCRQNVAFLRGICIRTLVHPVCVCVCVEFRFRDCPMLETARLETRLRPKAHFRVIPRSGPSRTCQPERKQSPGAFLEPAIQAVCGFEAQESGPALPSGAKNPAERLPRIIFSEQEGELLAQGKPCLIPGRTPRPCKTGSRASTRADLPRIGCIHE